MNLRLFSTAILISALPALADVSLNKGDFLAAQKMSRDGEAIVSVKLSKSGKAKLKKLATGEKIHANVAGVESDFKLREPIAGDGLEMGPYTNVDASKVVSSINGQ